MTMDVDETITVETQMQTPTSQSDAQVLLNWTLKAQQAGHPLAFLQFVDMVQRLHAQSKLDMHMLFVGEEGSGKSATAVLTAAYCDPTWIFHVKERLILSPDEIIYLYKDLDERLREVEAGKNTKMLRNYVWDEAQNILHRRKAMSKQNIDLVQLLMTMRVALAGLYYCTPNLLTLERDALRRVNMIAICDRGTVYVYINSITFGSKRFFGGAQWMIDRLHQYKHRTESIPKMTPETLEKIRAYPDLIAKVPFFTDIYRIYEKFKIEKTLEFIQKLREKLASAQKDEVVVEEDTSSINVKVIHGGDMAYREVIGDTIYTNDYYRVKAVAQFLGWGDKRMNNTLKRLNIPSIRYKGKKFILGKHVVRIIQES